jgi:hypothetical protein
MWVGAMRIVVVHSTVRIAMNVSVLSVARLHQTTKLSQLSLKTFRSHSEWQALNDSRCRVFVAATHSTEIS